MVEILETQVIELLTLELGRAPTAAEIANGMIAPQTLAQIHNTLNVTQSILAVNPGADLQSAITKLTSNGGGVLYLNAGTYNLIDNLILSSGIRIQGVGSDNSIIDFGNGAYQIQMIGTLGNEIVSPSLQGITVQNSTTDLVGVDYAINFGTNDLTCRNGLSGINITNTVTANIYGSLQDNCETGLIGTDSILFTLFSSNVTNCTSGGGVVLDNVTNSTSIGCSVDATIGGGYIFTNSSNFGFEDFSITNITGIGIAFSGGGSGIGVIDGFVGTCSEEGMKLDSTSSVEIVANTITGNTGYGINISSVSSEDNLIGMNYIKGNTAGAVTDSGTTTLIRSNIGVADN